VSRCAQNAYNYKPENINALSENVVFRKIFLAATFRTLNT
jgi:hypothetical protein